MNMNLKFMHEVHPVFSVLPHSEGWEGRDSDVDCVGWSLIPGPGNILCCER